MAIGDSITSWRPGGTLDLYWCLVDSPVHAILALLVVSPLLISISTQQTYKAIVISGLTVVLLDIDHVVVAGSFSLYDITHLPSRPVTHSLLFAASCALLAYVLTRRGVYGWLVFGVLASHILRDASTGGTPFLWPLTVNRLAVSAYQASQIGIFLLSTIIAKLWYSQDSSSATEQKQYGIAEGGEVKRNPGYGRHVV